MNRIARSLLAAVVTSVVIVLPLAAAEQSQRYIVVLSQRSGSAPDVASLGGTIESRQEDQLVITIPPGSLAALKADPKVRYIERVGGQPSADEDQLIGVPSDPQPGGPASQTRRLTSRALGSTPWSSGNYAYDGSGNIIAIGSDNYLYDGVQRLRQSSTKGTIETYTYDGFGNMKTKTNTMIPDVLAATNRYLGYGYNEIGAVTSDGSYQFSYDAVGQELSKSYNGGAPEYYLYTPSDERIGVQRGAWWTWSVRDEAGKVLRQYKSSVTNPSAPSLWVEDFVWRDGLLLGSQRPAEMGGRRHFHLDHLGSPRLITSDNGQLVSYHDYYPFGDEQSPVAQEGPSAGGFDREEPMKFTGHERDYAGGMGGEDGHAIDDMHARYYSATVGRFLSPDPLLGNLLQPQSWNRYAYVFDSPMTYIDPFGLAGKESASGPAPGNEDCPPGTEGIICFTHTAPDPGPVPQLPKGAIVRQSFFWDLADRPLPITGMSVNEHQRVTVHALAAFADGVIPDVPFCNVCDKYTDPFAGAGFYDVNEPGMRSAQIAGVPTGEVAMAAIGGQVIRTLELGSNSRLLAKTTGLLNKNDYLRVGWSWRGSRKAGQPIFRAVAGGRNVLRSLPAWLRHMDFW